MSRRLYLYRPGHPKANERGFVAAEDAGYEDSDPRVAVLTDRYMEGAVATDGTDIGSRRKRRDWMRANNLVDTSDFTNHIAKKQAERDAAVKPGAALADVKRDAIEAYRRRKGY